MVPGGRALFQQKSLRDLLSGLIFIAFGLAFAYAAFGYEIGTPRRMGPGLFPIVLAAILVGLGILVMIKAATDTGATDLGPIPWRALVLITGGLAFFGLTVKGIGLAPALAVTTFLSALASRENGPVFSLIFALVLTVFCYFIFVRALGMTAPVFGPWLAG